MNEDDTLAPSGAVGHHRPVAEAATEPPSVDRGLLDAGIAFEDAAARARAGIARNLFGSAAPAAPLLADRYRLGERLGAGGQGTVWRARDERLRRDVAIKVMHVRKHASAERSERWLRHEAGMLSRVAHPNVVVAFDLGFAPAWTIDPAAAPDDDVLFVVMELVDGESLRDWIARQRPEQDEILAMIQQIALALDAVGAAGLVHCDVKPSNILIAGRVAKLADFGLAHAARAVVEELDAAALANASTQLSDGTPSGSMTAKGAVGGTPTYMPPEQFGRGRIDARSDEYALAVTLFEALFGKLPHPADSLAGLRDAKLGGAPSCPDPKFGAAAYAALARSLSADPLARHGSATAMVEAIVQGRRRAHSRLVPVVVALAGFVAGGVWAGAGARDTCDAHREPLAAAQVRELERKLAEGGDDSARRVARRTVDELVAHDRALGQARVLACAVAPPRPEVLGCLDRVEAGAAAVVAEFDGLDAREAWRASAMLDMLVAPERCLHGDADPREVGPALAADDAALRTAWARFSSARAARAAGRPMESLAILDELAATPTIGPLAEEVDLTRAVQLDALGRYDESVALYREIYERATAVDEALIAARAAEGLAFVVGRKLGRADESASWIRHAEAQLERAGGSPSLAADLANTSGTIAFVGGQQREARAHFERALELAGRADASPRRLAAIRVNYAIVLLSTGDPNALEQLIDAQRQLEEVLGPEHPDVIDALANVGNALARFDRYDEARVVLERALALREAMFGPDALENARLLSVLGDLDRIQGDHVTALERMRAARALRERALPPDHPERAEETFDMVDLMLETGDLEGAASLLEREADRFASAFAPDHYISLELARTRGVIAHERGRDEEAAALLGRAVRGAIASGRDGEQTLQWMAEAAEAEAALGRFDRVREYLDAADAAEAWPHPEVRARLVELRAALPR